jgi:hypothetical protein
MKKLLVTAIALALLGPAYIAAQDGPSIGDRVRLQQVDGTVLVGTVEGISMDELVLGSATTDSRTLSLGGIESIERSLGEQRRFGRNLAISMGIAAGAGGLLSAVSWSPCRETGFMACFLHPESRGQAFTWGFVAGGVIGLPVGVIVGLAAKGERWQPIARPAVGRVALGLVTGGGRGVGVRASIPFGGHRR